MTSPATPRRSRKRVPESLDSPSKVIEFIKDLANDPLIQDELKNALRDTAKVGGNLFGAAILAFSSYAATIGQGLPGGFKVEASTLSQEVANRENLSVKGAHALMLRREVNSRGLNGILARAIIRADSKSANLQELQDIVGALPRGSFRAGLSRRLRVLIKRRRR